jgi:hypothetical protein
MPQAPKTASSPSASTGDDDGKWKMYIIVVGILLALAAVSTLFVSVAVKPGSCSNILGQTDYGCVLSQAAYSSNLTECGALPQYYADQCYSEIAMNSTNANACTKISDSNLSQECMLFVANATMNATACGSLPTSLADDCIQSIAVNRSSMQTCALIKDVQNRTLCISIIDLENAVATTNKSMCAAIKLNSNENQTLSAIGATLSRLSAANSNMSAMVNYIVLSNQTIGLRDFCYTMLAFDTGSGNYCAYVSSPNSGLCNSTSTRHASQQLNSSSVNYTSFMNSCELGQNYSQCNNTVSYLKAFNARNLTDCKSLKLPYSYQCYYTIAQIYNNTKYCGYIKNSSLNSQCIIAVTNGAAYINGTAT